MNVKRPTRIFLYVALMVDSLTRVSCISAESDISHIANRNTGKLSSLHMMTI